MLEEKCWTWKELVEVPFIIHSIKGEKYFQIRHWLKRLGYTFDADFPPDGNYHLLVKNKTVTHKQEKSEGIQAQFNARYFITRFIYCIKLCDNKKAHELFEDAIVILSLFGEQDFSLWYSTLTEDEKMAAYYEMELHKNEICNYLKGLD